MSIIKVYAIGINGDVADTGSGCEQSIDCSNIASIKNGYIIRQICCGGKVTQKVSLGPSVPADANDLPGVIITMNDGKQLFVNSYDATAVTTVCNACCGESTDLSGVAPAAFTPPSSSTAKCLTTTGDDGSQNFFNNQVALRIYGQYDITKGISRFATNKFTFYSTDAAASIVVPSGWTVANGACS